jgi:hypothetical protein
MDSAVLSASAGLIGSLIGGMSTFAASWLTQRRLLRTQTLVQDKMQRQALYSDFIIEASRRLTEAWSHQAEGPEVIAGLYSAVSRMRLTSSNEIIKRSEQVIRSIIAAYADPNRTFDEFKEHLHNPEPADPLKVFTEACREELISLRT